MAAREDVREWFWGECTTEFVDGCLNDMADGTFLVFTSGNPKLLTLAIRIKQHNKYVDIVHEDGLFGFTEPLNFYALADALDAYNFSPTETFGTLIYPASKPQLLRKPSNVSLTQLDPVRVLRNLRQTHSHTLTKIIDLEKVVENMKTVAKELEEVNTTIEGLNVVLKMLETQKSKHTDVSKRLSTIENTKALSDNYALLNKRLADVRQEQQKAISKRISCEEKMVLLTKEHAQRIAAIQKLQSDLASEKRQLLYQYPSFATFLNYLLTEDSFIPPDTVIHNINKKEAETCLKDSDDGMFLVRKNIQKTSSQHPFIVSVSFDENVQHMPVLRKDGYFGFDETTCVFTSIHDLVTSYGKIPFRAHNLRYNDLTLKYQVQIDKK